MKVWNKIIGVTITCILVLMAVVTTYLYQMREDSIPNETLADINRMYAQLQEGKTISQVETEGISIRMLQEDELQLETYMHNAAWRLLVLPTNQEGAFYLFTYRVERFPITALILTDAVFLIVLGLILFMILFIHRQIIRPFHRMEDVAEALKNRDFYYELPQQKYKLFGKFLWAIDVMREELRHHEQKELELLKEKQLMISSLSHDIKTPLSSIRLYNEAVTQGIYPPETIIQRIEENCEKIDQYVKDIMNASQEDLFDFSVHVQELYFHDIVAMLQQEKERVELAMISYEVASYCDGLVAIDLYRLKEVIHNIIDNAMKYGDHTWIRVSFYEEEYHRIIQITNAGSSISKQDSTAIFQSFYRGNNIGKQEGHGLGLYICKQLMKKMGGDIYMSQKEGEVSFHIVLGAM